MSDVLLATCAELPDGEPGADLLGPLAARGVHAAWAVWDDTAVDWSAARLVAARATWDYQDRPEAFLAWARAVDGTTALLNGADTFAWNVDKSYLVPLADDVPTVPTRLLEPDPRAALADAVAAWGEVVVKPRTGASGIGVLVVTDPDDPRVVALGAPALAQPLVPSVRTEGETSVFVLDGRAVAQVDKRPAAGEIRVHDEYGGTTTPVPLDDERAALSERAVAAAAARWGGDLAYARVDLLRLDEAHGEHGEHGGTGDGWAVGELELVEPGLYLDVLPGMAEAFADLVAARLGRLPA